MDTPRRDDSLGEELSALNERAKGAAKDAYGSLTGDRQVELEGERQKADGKIRQETNNVMDETDGVRGATARSGGLVTGMYSSPDHAHRAYNDLTTRHGYKSDEVNVLMSDETRKRHFGDAKPGEEFDRGNKAAEGTAVGGGIGMGVGAALGALLAVGGSIALPGLGLVVAGPLAAVLAGAGAGGTAGGLIGALVGAGIPEDRAKEYESGIKNGGIVIATRPRDDRHAEELQRDYDSWGATNVRM
jgi:uncharacterized protein YjbJ (UPF0337 family)